MLIASGQPLVQVAYQAAGAGITETAGGSIGPDYPSGIVAGHGLLLHVMAADPTLAFVNLPSGWTTIDTRNVGATFESKLMWKIADGSESGALSVTVGDLSGAWARMYRFNRVKSIESATGQIDNSSSTNMPASNLTGTGVAAAALQVMGARVNTTIGNIAGESGGDYTEAVAEYATGGGTPAMLSLQSATLALPGTINGGAATLGAAATGRVTHAVILKP